ncbi:hypothetical protein C8J56DRAFT_952473 [Mycena floridula]|nr:hypothetical protein C8J56DRAFT_952473 [Mycena floridula]
MLENSATSQCTSLPFELIQELVNHLEDDRTTLRSICLVSRTWREAAVVHLFSRIQLSDEEDFEMWLEIIRKAPGLAIRQLKTVSYRVGGTETKSARPVSPSLLSPIPPIRVDTLQCFFPCDEVVYFTSALSQYLSMFLTISHLRLGKGKFTEHSDLVNFIAACGKLQSLHLEGIYLEDSFVPSQDSFFADFSRLQRMVVLCSYSDDIPWETQARIINAAAATLEYLHCAPTGYKGTIGRLHRPLISLKTLELEFFGRYAKIEAFLYDLPSAPKLAQLVLEFAYLNNLTRLEHKLKKSDWDNFTRLVTRRFPAFKQFTLRVRRQNHGEIDAVARGTIVSLVQKYFSQMYGDPSRFKLEILPTE